MYIYIYKEYTISTSYFTSTNILYTEQAYTIQYIETIK